MKKFIYSFLLAMSFVYCHPLSAEHSGSNTLHIYTEIFKPLHFQDREKRPAGFVIDVVEELLRRNNLVGEYHFIPWSRSLNFANKEKNTLVFSMIRTSEREENYYWIGSVFREPPQSNLTFDTLTGRMKVWKLKGSDIEADSMAQLYQLSTCAPRSDSLTDSIVQELKWPDARIFETLSWQKAFSLFLNKRCDVFIAREFTMSQHLATVGRKIDAVVPVLDIDEDLHPITLYLVMGKNTQLMLVDALSQSLHKMKSDGTYDAIEAKWLALK